MRELWRKTNYEEWLYRRSSHLSVDDENIENSIYELPERVSSAVATTTPSSSYYSSATILASDSAAYSAYY